MSHSDNELSKSTEYPKAMWRADGHYREAHDKVELEQMLSEGWSTSYIPSKRPMQAQGNVQASGVDPLLLGIREVLESVLDERGLGKSLADRRGSNGAMQWPPKAKQEMRKNG